jgi:hypothetical protein
MTKKYDTIFLDWDGVIWNFKRAFCDWIGRDVPDTDKWEFYEALGMSASMFQGSLSRLPREFWEQDRYILPHAHDLVAWARRNANYTFILTVAPEQSAIQGKKNLASDIFNLRVCTVAKAEDKVEFASKGCLLIDDRGWSVVQFASKFNSTDAYVWPANYNQGLDDSWYFQKSWLHEHKAHWALTDSDRADMLKGMKAEEVSIGSTMADVKDAFATAGRAFAEKPKLDYEEKADTIKEEKVDRFAGTIHDVNLYDYSGKIEEIEMKPTNPKDIAGSKKAPVNSMIPGAVKAEIGVALLEGALKYGRHNYRQDGVRASVYYDAVGRHLDAWWEGEDVDEESGLSHITKAIAGLIILRDCSIRGMCNDDRPPKTIGFMREVNEKTKALIEKYPNPVPPVLNKSKETKTDEPVEEQFSESEYTQYSDGSRSFIREFSREDSQGGEFEWHRDHYDRRVRALNGVGCWSLQFEGQEPVLLTSEFLTIKKGQEHRLLSISDCDSSEVLKVEVFEYPDGIPEQSGCCGKGGCC